VWFVQYLYNFVGQASPTVPTAPRWVEAPELDSRVDLALTAKSASTRISSPPSAAESHQPSAAARSASPSAVPRQPRRYCREIFQMPIRPHQASNDEGFGIRVIRVSLHRVADGPWSTLSGRSVTRVQLTDF